MKLSVIGAGHMGSAIVSDLVARSEVSIVRVCDAHTRSLAEIEARVDNSKLRVFKLDARDISTLAPVLEGSDCVIGASLPALNPGLAETCLEIGSHFCDLGGTDELVRRQLALDRTARNRGLWIVPNCGLSPGLVNILCIHAVNQFDSVEAARIRVGDVPLVPVPPFNFRIAWSAGKLLDDYTRRVQIVENGELKEVEPLALPESISFSDPFGSMEAFCTAGSIQSVWEAAGHQIGSIDHKTVRWPGHAEQMRFLLALGFAEEKIIDVRTHLTYRDVLARRLKQRLGGTFEDAVLMRISSTGLVNGVRKRITFEMIERYDHTLEMTAMRKCTGLATTTVALMLARRSIRGAGAALPEMIVPGKAYLDALTEHGLDIRETWDTLK